MLDALEQFRAPMLFSVSVAVPAGVRVSESVQVRKECGRSKESCVGAMDVVHAGACACKGVHELPFHYLVLPISFRRIRI